MAAAGGAKKSFLLPKLKYKFKTATETDRFAFYDVKFYPYSKPADEQPVFAVVGQKMVLIGRLSAAENPVVTMLHELVDEQEAADENSPGLNSCAWCYIDPHAPLLAVAGGSGQLKVIDATDGQLFATYTGHGHGTINDIATHPFYPWIVATASMDKSLRIWDLRRVPAVHAHESSTVIVCGQATGHCEGVLTVSWHGSGRYLITGGHDQRVCVWTLPDLGQGSSFWRDISREKRERSAHEILTIYYPHFVSSSVHSNFVDCARFFGDLVISKAANEDKIVLWEIPGFEPHRPPPTSATAPKTEEHLDTRNGFVRRTFTDGRGIVHVHVAPEYQDSPLYRRLLEFETPRIEQFYLRFGLLTASADYPDIHPVLAFANAMSELRFWDLRRLSLGHGAGVEDGKTGAAHARRKPKGIARVAPPADRASRAHTTPSSLRDLDSPPSLSSNMSSAPGLRHSSTDEISELSDANEAPAAPVRNREKYPIHDPHVPLKPHSKVALTDLQFKNAAFFNARAVDWSPCGRWCIVVGESARQSGEGVEGIGGFAVLYR